MKTCIMKGHSFWRILIALCLVVSTMWVTAPPAEAAPPPTITSVTPGFGLICGGTVVTIAGNGLGGPLGTVTFNGVSATGISQVGSPPSYVCTTPASAAAGLATIVLTTFGGTTTNSTLFTYLIPVPTISNILPNSGPPEGGTVVTINGTNFTGATAVQFGGIDADGYTVNSATQITATNPATLNEGAVDVSVTTPVGTATLTLGFTYTNTVEVTSILPNAGPLGGGTTVTVVGANFYDGIILTIGGNSCTSVFLVDSSHLIATTPSGTAGAKDVGVGTATLTASFTYFDFPTIVSIAPASGSDLGGIVATITGTNFYSPATVTVGGNAATNITVDNNTQIRATTPAGTDGAADVSVTTNSGGPATLTGGFTYTLPIPAVIGCNPPDGSQSGGKLVTITGTNFFNTADLAVTFNGDPATGVMAVSQTSIICATPNYSPGVHVPGAVFVIVTCNGVSSVPMNAYTYLANPVITSISPSTGITTGGTNVTIFGANFINPPSTVTFGGIAATSVIWVDASHLVVTTPVHAVGIVDVTEIQKGCTGTLTGGFTYSDFTSPVVSSIVPNVGPVLGGTVVTINGANFSGATAVNFGATAAASFSVVSASQITATAPAGTFDTTVDVTVTVGLNTSTTSTADQFTYTYAISISSIYPAGGSPVGGATVTIIGANFGVTPTVTIGGSSCTSVFLVDPSHMTAVTPVGLGTQDVTVTNPDFTSATLTGGFTYYNEPTITGLSPITGSIAGGTVVTIIGTNFYSPATVTIGGNAVTGITVVSATSITATTPSGASGAADVVVTTLSGTSAALVGAFTYTVPVPTITSCNPPDGSQSGGKAVTITGTNFVSPATVTFDGNAATGVTIVSATSITCTTPAHSPGAVPVIVTCNGVSSTPMNAYTYIVNPVVTSVSPAIGPTAGGTTVTIHGANFVAMTTFVTFDSTAAMNVVFVDANTLTAVTPLHPAGEVTVAVIQRGCVGTLTGGYYYADSPSPTVNGISPDTGPTAGGTVITITGTNFVAGATVTIGGNSATSVTFVDLNHLLATTPTHAPGAVDLTVINPDLSPATLTNGFTYYVPVTYAITYDGNGNSSGTAPTDANSPYSSGATVIVLGNTGSLTRTGYSFNNWNTAADGTGTSYAPSDTLVIAADTTLYAQWAITQYNNYAPMVSAGYWQTVGLESDGTAIAVGYNGSGQCNVGSWTDIVQVSSNAWYTVGLKSNGTVVAVGNMGEKNVSSWSTIIQISTNSGGDHIVGLKADGTVVAVGANGNGQCNVGSWTDITQVSAGPNNTIGRKSDGTVVAVGDNNLGQCDINSWSDITQVSAGGQHTLGLKADGTVVAAGHDNFGQCDVSSWSNITQISAGGLHSLGLRSNGTVLAIGNNIDGECNVSSWNLITGTPTTNTVYFNSNGGSPIEPITQAIGTTITAPVSPTRAGYTFTGWNPAVPSIMPAYDITCVAQWTVNQYTISFDSAGGSPTPASITQDYGTAVTAPADPTRAGYTFSGWNPSVPATMPAYGTTCVAQWTVNQYTISFDSAGGSVVASITQNYGTIVTAPAAPTKTGYTFAGWLPAVPATMPAYDTACVAQWTVSSHTVSFSSNGGTGNMAAQTASAPTALTLNTFTRVGYSFNGWNNAANGSGTAYADGAWYAFTVDASLYAQWTVNSYTVTFNNNGGSGVTPTSESVNFGALVTAPTTMPTWTGYTLSGWNTAANGSGTTWNFASTSMGAAAMTLYAQWMVNSYTVTFNNNGGSGVTPTSEPVNFGALVTAPTTMPTWTGYTLSGWNTAANGSGTTWNFASTSMGAAAMTLYAQWVDNTAPSVNINQAIGQADPTNASPINFTVVFSEPVTDFANGDVTVNSGTAVVTGSGTTYNVAVSGMIQGTLTVSLAAGVAHDAAGNANIASTSTDNSVVYALAESVNLVLLPTTQTIGTGSTFNVTVQAQCGAQTTDGIDVYLDFDPAFLTIQSATAGTSLPIVLMAPAWDNNAGTFGFSAGKLGLPFPSGTFNIVTITFKAMDVTTDPSQISFHNLSSRKTTVDFGGSDITGTLSGATVNIFADVPLYLDPADVESLYSGQTFNIDINTNVDADQQVSGVQAYIYFDPTKLEVVDSDSNQAGIQITKGTTLPTILENSVNNTSGLVTYSAGKLGSPFPSGSFTVATIQFRAKTVTDTVTTPVTISLSGTSTTSMVDFSGTAIVGTHGDAAVQIIPGAIVNISAVLQGGSRPDVGWVVPLTVKFFAPGADVLTATPLNTLDLTTAKSGSTAAAQAIGINPGTYDISVVTPHCLTNVKRGVVITMPSTSVNLGTLLEGNANDNNIVNIQDFGFLAVAFGKSSGAAGYDAQADFDRNGLVNISDFGLLAVNYGKNAPVIVP